MQADGWAGRQASGRKAGRQACVQIDRLTSKKAGIWQAGRQAGTA